jgi:sulfite reductase (ferredoxin)
MGANFRIGDEFSDFLPEEEIFLLAQAIKEVFDARGNRKNKHAARLRFLVEEMGLDAFRERVRERIEAVKARGDWRIELPEAFAVEPLVDALVSKHLPDFSPEEKLWFQRFARPQKQSGYYSVKLPLPLGDLAAADARALADALPATSPHGAETLRFSGDQNIYLRNLNASALRALYPVLKKISPLVTRPALLGDILVCTGAATCQLGITVPRGALGAIEKAVTQAGIDLDTLQGLRIHLSGCPNSCGKHAVADLGFFGKALRNNGIPYPAYKVFAGAKIGAGITRFAYPVGEVAAFHLPAFIVEVLQAWLPHKAAHAKFADWIDRDGKEIIGGIAKKHVAVPEFDEDKNPYFDFSARELFSLKGRGAGECSAGLYELIETDKKALTAALKEAATLENLALIRLYSARMLLITRGEEARSEKEVFKAFKTLFIDTGLIDASFAPLLEGEITAVTKVTPAQIDDLRRLARAIIDLYGTMDYTLKFAVEREAAVTPVATAASGKSPATPAAVGTVGATDEAVHRFKDYRGVACPMNFVKTKMDLSQMKNGEILEILLDDGAPIDNVPASVKSEGHTVLSQMRQGDVWHVKIRKK